jgi:hypothetical protein
VQITRDGDRLVIDFPPVRSAAGLWIYGAVTLGTSLLCLVGTFWPGGVTRIGDSVVTHPGGVAPRLISFALAAFLAGLLWSGVRTRRIHSVITVRGKTLTFARAGAWREVSDDYDLSHYDDVGIASDDGSIFLALLRRDGNGSTPLASGSSTKAEQRDLERAAGAIRQAAWPDLAAGHPRSEFTWVNHDTLESDRGFTVRMPGVGVVEYREPHGGITLSVERAWSADHAMCFVIRPDALARWDGASGPAALAPEKQREIRYNLSEALEHLGLRLLLHRVGPDEPSSAPHASPAPHVIPRPTRTAARRSRS